MYQTQESTLTHSITIFARCIGALPHPNTVQCPNHRVPLILRAQNTPPLFLICLTRSCPIASSLLCCTWATWTRWWHQKHRNARATKSSTSRKATTSSYDCVALELLAHRICAKIGASSHSTFANTFFWWFERRTKQNSVANPRGAPKSPTCISIVHAVVLWELHKKLLSTARNHSVMYSCTSSNDVIKV